MAGLLACALASPVARAAAPSPAATHQQLTFSSVPGVPRNVVPSLAQDRAGLLWLGTGDGLARFDGYRLQPVEQDGPDALARNMGWVRALAAGPDGRMWIGTESAGLAVHDPDNGRIRSLGGPQSGAQASITALALDTEGRVWVGTVGSGLYRYDDRSGRFEVLALPGLPAGSGQVFSFSLGPDGSLWVGHWGGLARWQPGQAEGVAVALPPHPERAASDPVLAVLAAPDGTLWLGTQRGLLARASTGQSATWLAAQGRGAVQALAIGSDGLLWAGHRAGLDLVDPASGQLRQRLVHRPDQPAGLAGNEVTELLRDPTGAMWVAGFGVGLQRHQSNPAIAVRGPDPDPRGPLRDADVRALLTLADQRLLAATHAGSVAMLDADLRVLGAFPYEGPPLEALAEDVQGRLWLASRGRVKQVDAQGRVLRSWEHDGGAALHLQCEPDGTVWLGAERGLLRWRPGEARFLNLSTAQGRILDSEVFDLAADGAGGLWVAARAGLHRLPAGSDTLQPVAAAPGHSLGFSVVIGLLRDRQGTLWVDTPVAGLHRHSGHDAEGRPKFERISIRHGVAGRPFGANLHADAQGRIWSQAFVYDPAADRLDELRPADGAQFGTPWFRSHTQLADGRLVFGGSRGLMQVNPARFAPSSDQPPLVFSSLRVNGAPYQPTSMRAGLTLGPGVRSFGVEFAALDFADPQLVRYRYRLVGFDPEWLHTDANFRSPSYSQLPPGNYTLEVEATNRSGIWSPHTLRLAVRVEPAWWQAAWVPWALAAGLVAGVWGWVGWRTQRLRARQAELEALVLARTTDLRKLSLTDPLTGLRNRRYLLQRIDEDLQIVQRQHQHAPGRDDADLLVFLIDLDHFKAVNDTHGHVAGDTVLTHTAEVLRRVFRDSDTLVRWGGEEFLVVARASQRSHAGELAERLRRELQDQAVPVGTDGATPQMVRITASIGFVAYPPDPARPAAWHWNAVVQLADAALYAAKAAGRNGWVGVLGTGVEPVAGGHAKDWLQDPATQVQRAEA